MWVTQASLKSFTEKIKMLHMALLSSSGDTEFIKPRACPAIGRDGPAGVGCWLPPTDPEVLASSLTQGWESLVASSRSPSWVAAAANRLAGREPGLPEVGEKREWAR